MAKVQFYDRGGTPITPEEYWDGDRTPSVARNLLPDGRTLSTIYRGVSVGKDEAGRPLIYETAAFPNQVIMAHWATEEEALAGHKKILEQFFGTGAQGQKLPEASRYLKARMMHCGFDTAVDLTNIHPARLREIEAGEIEPTPHEKARMASRYGVSKEYLSGKTDRPELPLTFAHLRDTNLARSNQSYHPGPDGIKQWSLTDWATAVGGEAGSVLHVCKKMRREFRADGSIKFEDGEKADTWDARRERVHQLRGQLADELADLILYADLLAAHQGIDLAAAIVRKFNLKSEEIGSDHKL